MVYNRSMEKKAKKSSSDKKERYVLHSVIAFLVLAALIGAAVVLLPGLGLSGRGIERSVSAETPAPASAEPTPTPGADASVEPVSASPSETPAVSDDPEPTPEAETYVQTRLVIDGAPFASLASRQAAEELINTAVSHFEQLCPGTSLVTEIENRIEYVDAPASDSITSFDEAFVRLIGEDSPLVVRTVFTRSDLETLPCSSSEQASDQFYQGTRFVSSYGRDGKKLLLNEYTYINGILSAFTLLEESVLTEPVDELVFIGTRPVPNDASPARDFGFSECPPTDMRFAAPVNADVIGFYGFYDGEFNRGIDFGCAAGQKCYAPCGGTVSAVLTRGNLGLVVEISHGGGIVTRYTNLQAADVSIGSALIEGDVIGSAGDGGLHFELIVNGIPRNPLYYITLPGHSVLG